MYIAPNKGYVFDGFYSDDDTLGYDDWGNRIQLKSDEAYDGKTIKAKFRKATAAEKKVRTSKITNLKAKVTKGKIKVTWSVKGAKMDGYVCYHS